MAYREVEICSAPDCDRWVSCKGMCRIHYARAHYAKKRAEKGSPPAAFYYRRPTPKEKETLDIARKELCEAFMSGDRNREVFALSILTTEVEKMKINKGKVCDRCGILKTSGHMCESCGENV